MSHILETLDVLCNQKMKVIVHVILSLCYHDNDHKRCYDRSVPRIDLSRIDEVSSLLGSSVLWQLTFSLF